MNKVRFLCGAMFLGVVGLGWAAAQAQQRHEDPAGMGMPMTGMPTMGRGMGMMEGAMHQTAR